MWRYSAIGVRLPNAFDVTISTSLRWSSMTSIATTSSPFASDIALTPRAGRPIGRTSFSLKWIAIPSCVARMMSRSPLLRSTASSSSSSSRPIAIKPLRRTFSNSASLVFLMTPRRVTITRYSSVSNARTGNSAVTISPGGSVSRLTSAVPRSWRVGSGISYARRRNARPLLVKNRTYWCVVATKKLRTTSSFLRLEIPMTPRPPRFGAGNVSTDTHLGVLVRPPRAVAQPLLEIDGLFAHDAQDARRLGEQIGEVGHERAQFAELVLNLLALEPDERAQPHVDDRGGLPRVKQKVVADRGAGHAAERVGQHERFGDEPLARHLDGVALANDRDDAVDVVERDQEAEQQVRALFVLAQLVARAALDAFLAMVDEVQQDVAQAEDLRLERRRRAGRMLHLVAAAHRHQREHVEREAGLQRRLLVELVEHHLRRRVARELHDDAHPLAVRLVVEPHDPDDALVLIRFDDRFDDARRRHLIGDLADDDLVAALLLDDLGLAAQLDGATARLIRLPDRFAAHQDAAGREVGTLHDVAQRVVDVLDAGVRAARLVLDQVRDRVADLADVVRRDVGRHADRDPRAAVDEQLRQPGGQHDRLFGLIVEVGDELDGLFVDVYQHVERCAREARFGVPVRGGPIRGGGTEVAVAVDERIPQREVLRHAHERVVHRRVAVRVIALEHLADDARALAMLLGRIEAHLAHRVEDAALHRLEAVAHVGERPRRDDGHGIGEVALPHLVFDGDRGHPGVVVHWIFLRFRMKVRLRARRAPRVRPRRAQRSPGAVPRAGAAPRGARRTARRCPRDEPRWRGSPSPRRRVAVDEVAAVGRIALLEQCADQEADDAADDRAHDRDEQELASEAAAELPQREEAQG